MDKFMMNPLNKMNARSFVTGQNGVDESKPADVGAGKKPKVQQGFTAMNADGPMIIDAAKKGTGAVSNDWAKINSQADDHSAIVNAAK